MIILFDGDIRNDGFGVLKKRNRLRAIVLIRNVRIFILEIILLSSFPEKVCWGKNLHTVCKGISYTGCPKQKLTNRTKSKQKLSALGPNFPMNMTWGRLILLSLSKKRPKSWFPDTRGVNYWWLSQCTIGPAAFWKCLFLGHPAYHILYYILQMTRTPILTTMPANSPSWRGHAFSTM